MFTVTDLISGHVVHFVPVDSIKDKLHLHLLCGSSVSSGVPRYFEDAVPFRSSLHHRSRLPLSHI